MVKALYNGKIRIMGILTITLLRFGITSSDALASGGGVPGGVYLQNLLLSFVNTALAWEANRLLVVYLTQKYGLRQTINSNRFWTDVVLILIVNTILYLLFLVVMMLIDSTQRPALLFLFFGLIDRCIYGLLIAGFYELLVFVQALQSARQEAEALKQLNVAIQLESLKNQVKPHFLFNSLNTLTGLVETNSTESVRFINELSNVYRYLLQSNEKELITLSEELQFCKAYFFLLQMRFGEGVQMKEDIPSGFGDYLLPPLTLQILLENCIKHNQVSLRRPLTIAIYTEDDRWLVVSNNLQLKRSPHSTGIGLSNIAAKLKLLNQPAIEVMKTAASFIIKIPLIKPVSA